MYPKHSQVCKKKLNSSFKVHSSVQWITHFCLLTLATTIQYQRYGLVCKGNSSFESCVEGKSEGREILCALGSHFRRLQHLTSSDQLCLYKMCTVMGDLKGAPAVHFNSPLQSFSLCITFKSGMALPVSLFLRNRGGLVSDCCC